MVPPSVHQRFEQVIQCKRFGDLEAHTVKFFENFEVTSVGISQSDLSSWNGSNLSFFWIIISIASDVNSWASSWFMRINQDVSQIWRLGAATWYKIVLAFQLVWKWISLNSFIRFEQHFYRWTYYQLYCKMHVRAIQEMLIL